MTQQGNNHTSERVAAESTAVFRADCRDEPHPSAPADADRGASAAGGLPSGSALLVERRGPDVGATFLLNRPVTSAGRHPRSDIFLDDVTVSRHHAEFRVQRDGVVIIDVGSLNGTYVNRQPVDSAVLANGDEIQIGKFRLNFWWGA